MGAGYIVERDSDGNVSLKPVAMGGGASNEAIEALQAQLNGKVDIAGSTMTGPLNLVTPAEDAAGKEAVNAEWVIAHTDGTAQLWGKRVYGPIPEGEALATLLSDMAIDAYIYFTQGKSTSAGVLKQVAQISEGVKGLESVEISIENLGLDDFVGSEEFAVLQNAVEEVKTTANNAQTQAADAQTKAAAAEEAASTASENAATAIDTATEAKNTADGLADSIDAANSTAEAANSTATNAESLANEAKTTANTAKTTAEAAALDAANALSQAQTASDTAQSAAETATAAATEAKDAHDAANAAYCIAKGYEEQISEATTKADAAESAASGIAAIETTANSAKTTADSASAMANSVKSAVENTTTGLAATKSIADAAKAKADTSMQLSGDQTVADKKTFTGTVLVPAPVTTLSVKNPSVAQLLSLTRTADPLTAANIQFVEQLINALKTEVDEDMSGYLPLAGGTIKGGLTLESADPIFYIKNTGLSTDETVSANKFIRNSYVDKDGQLLFQQGFSSNPNSDRTLFLNLYKMVNGSLQNAQLSINYTAGGKKYISCNTPDTDAPNTAVYNKAALNRDFLSKSGGDVTGDIVRKLDSLDSNESSVPSSDKNCRVFRTSIGKTDVGYVEYQHFINNSLGFGVVAHRGVIYSSIKAMLDKDNVDYATCSHPRTNTYGNDIVTMKAFKDLTVVHPDSTNIYLGGTGASDTADLNVGRGFSPDKPFASLNALLLFLAGNIVDSVNNIKIVFQDNIIENNYIHCRLKNIAVLKFYGNGRTLTHRGLSLYTGEYWIDNLGMTLHSTGSGRDCFIYARDFAKIVLAGNITFNGAPTVAGVLLANHCYLGLYNTSTTVTGNVTGKRYQIEPTSIVNIANKGINFFPGTEVGTVADGGYYL